MTIIELLCVSKYLVGRGPTTQDNSFLIFLKASCHFRFVKPILCIETALRTKKWPFWTAGFGSKVIKMGAFYLLIANFFATQNIGGAKKKLVVLL